MISAVTQSFTKSLVGKIVVGVLAFSMIIGVVASLVVVLLQAANII